MESAYILEKIQHRDELTNKYPALIGRHAFYEKCRVIIIEGLNLLENKTESNLKRLYQVGTELLQARAQEQAQHIQRIRTHAGDEIHKSEFELYSFAFDTFQTSAKEYTTLPKI